MTVPYRASLVTALALALVACKDPNANVPRATSRPAAPAAPTAQPSAALEQLRFGAPQSTLAFTGAKARGTHPGSFTAFTGTVSVDPTNLSTSRVEVSIDMNSVQTDAERLTTHLKSADFFDVTTHPRASFTSTEVRAGGTNGATHTIMGNLSLHGVTKLLSFPATITVSAQEVRAIAEFSINRRDFGIVYPGMPDNLIRDDVALRLEIHAPRGGSPAAPAPAPAAPAQ